jgi:hypothetical protein
MILNKKHPKEFQNMNTKLALFLAMTLLRNAPAAVVVSEPYRRIPSRHTDSGSHSGFRGTDLYWKRHSDGRRR